MSVVSSKDDPRSQALEVPFSLPRAWYAKSGDLLATSGMFMAGLIMVTRNRFLAWPSLVAGINSLLNQHPMRQKESTAGWSNTGLCIAALFASYIPLFVVSPTPKA